MVNKLSHDANNSLTVVKIIGNTFFAILPKLMDAYKVAIHHHLVEPSINENILNGIDKNLLDFSESLEESFEFLLHASRWSKKLINEKENKQFSAKEWVQEFLQNYPFVDKAHCALIHTELNNDFYFIANHFFINHLFSRIFEIVLQNNKEAVVISIHNETNPIIKITNINMNEKELQYRFGAFFLKKEDILLPGLGFCRLSFLLQNGEVSYQFEDRITIFIKFCK